MRLRSFLLATLAISAFSSTATAETKDWALGGHALLGFADNDNLRQLPVQTSPLLTSNTDTAGVNGGAGLSLSYNLKNQADIPITVEVASTWRYRHDFNLNYRFGGLLYGAKMNVMSIDTMLSALYDIETGTNWTPYVGGGVGVVYHDIQNQHIVGATDIDVGDTSDVNMAWQLQAGVNYALSNTWDLRMDYRYIDLGEVHTTTMPTSSSRFTTDLYSHDIRIGAAWHF